MELTTSATSLNIALARNVGMVRDHQEDDFLVRANLANNVIGDSQNVPLSPWGALFVVADGMGGMNAGEVASHKAVEGIENYFQYLIEKGAVPPPNQIQDTLFKAINFANDTIIQHAKTYPDTEGMGTTLILLWLINDTAHVAWCGDSRCYMLRDGRLKQISKDHSYVQELVDKKLITSDEAFYHPKKNIVTQSLGDSMNKLEPSYTSVPLSINDRFLLCSDGLNTMLMDDHIQQIATSSTDIQECTQRLVEAANTAGGYDNITVVLTDVVTGPAASKQAPLARQKVSTPKTNNHTTSGGKKSFIAQNMLPIGVGLGLLLGGLLWLVLGRSSDKLSDVTAAAKAATITKDSLKKIDIAKEKKAQAEADAEKAAKDLIAKNNAAGVSGTSTINSTGKTVAPNPVNQPPKPVKPNMSELGKDAGQLLDDKNSTPPSGNPAQFGEKNPSVNGSATHPISNPDLNKFERKLPTSTKIGDGLPKGLPTDKPKPATPPVVKPPVNNLPDDGGSGGGIKKKK